MTRGPSYWGRRRPPLRRVSVGLLAGSLLMTMISVSSRAAADPGAGAGGTPAPTAGPATPEPSTTSPSSASSPSPSDSASTPPVPPSPGTTAAATPAPIPDPTVPTPSSPTPSAPGSEAVAAEAEGPITLTVASQGGPVAGAYYQDLGSYALSGRVSEAEAGTIVEIQQYVSQRWTVVSRPATDGGGRFTATKPVTAKGPQSFRAKVGNALSNQVNVTVQDSGVVLDPATASIDSLKTTDLTGRVVPARSGVVVTVAAAASASDGTVSTVTTDATGAFRFTFAYGIGRLATYDIRASFEAVNRKRTEVSAIRKITRAAVLDPNVAVTTDDDIAETYHDGCPVGKSQLSTVTMNYYGRDRRMHRGVIIVRKDLATEVIRGFRSALAHRYPVKQMTNPNVWGGNDPKQMEANNTSGFNCRHVVGNPYRMSPHSYGIAIDVNTVQNPYRDRNGKWWPKNGKSYIDRTPRRWGMLTKNSYLTKSLRKDEFFWGGFWSPGRDYQHFEYRG